MGIIKSGDNGNVANVTDEKKLEVAAVAESSLEFASKSNSCAFSWVSTYAATGGDEVISIKNTSTSKALIVDEVVVGCSAASVFTLFQVTSGTSAGNVDNETIGALDPDNTDVGPPPSRPLPQRVFKGPFGGPFIGPF